MPAEEGVHHSLVTVSLFSSNKTGVEGFECLPLRFYVSGHILFSKQFPDIRLCGEDLRG